MQNFYRTMRTRIAFIICIWIMVPVGVTAQDQSTGSTPDDYASQCEIHPTRSISNLPAQDNLPAQEKMDEVKVLPANAMNVLKVQGGDNGGILVRGSDNKEIVIVACKSTWAQDEASAQHLLNQLVLIIQNQEVRAEGPAKAENTMWRVNFIVFVPRKMEINLRTNNGGINLYGLEGRISAYSKNGGIYFAGSGGDIDLKTQNGGIELKLEEPVWNGKGLTAHSENGGLIVKVPNAYQSGILAMTASNQLQCKARICPGSERTWDGEHKILKTTTNSVAINVSTEHAPLQILGISWDR
jgi:hypothetical protein